MPFSDYALNLMANEVANRTLSVRIHTGDPGANGTANRIGSHEIAVAADGWTNAATGNVENVAAVAFGVLHTGNANTVRWYSLWDGSNFVARGEFGRRSARTGHPGILDQRGNH